MKMADEYIRLDTTIMGIDGLINEAPTGSQARALLCAKDMIYDQQRYVSEMEPVKRGRWIRIIGALYECTECKAKLWLGSMDPANKYHYCWMCGAKMDLPEPPKEVD